MVQGFGFQTMIFDLRIGSEILCVIDHEVLNDEEHWGRNVLSQDSAPALFHLPHLPCPPGPQGTGSPLPTWKQGLLIASPFYP